MTRCRAARNAMLLIPVALLPGRIERSVTGAVTDIPHDNVTVNAAHPPTLPTTCVYVSASAATMGYGRFRWDFHSGVLSFGAGRGELVCSSGRRSGGKSFASMFSRRSLIVLLRRAGGSAVNFFVVARHFVPVHRLFALRTVVATASLAVQGQEQPLGLRPL